MVSSIDLREVVLGNQGFGLREIEEICHTVSEDFTQLALFRDAVNELASAEEKTPAMTTRLGVCYCLLGRFDDAEATLKQGDGGAIAQYYLGKIFLQLENYDQSIQYFEAAKSAGYPSELCDLAIAEALRYSGRKDEAMRILDNMFGPVEQTAEYLYQRGATVAAVGGSRVETVAYFQRAITLDPKHSGALFGLALEYDRAGNDDESFELYKRAASNFPSHVGTLINLGVIYEDRNDYTRSQACFRRILDSFPDHPRAKLFLKDAAAGSMAFDEDAQRRNERLAQLLNVPVTDFELSVRARNCLQKMGIKSLGDLTRISEQQLLTSKNFGETSLVEIKEILSSRGLSIGQFAHEKREVEPPLDVASLSPDQQALLERPISDLNLSVRARKCMVRLQLTSIGELVRKTGDDLLECKNFGVTSLNEVREKLTNLGLKLRGD